MFMEINQIVNNSAEQVQQDHPVIEQVVQSDHSDHSDQINQGDIYIAKKTKPRKYDTLTSSRVSRKKEWLQIQGVPTKVVKVNTNTKMVTLNSLTSTSSRNFTISQDEVNNNFVKAVIVNNMIINSGYPESVNVGEFDARNKFEKLMQQIRNTVNTIEDETLKRAFKDKLFQMIQANGGPFIGIPKYENYIKGNIVLTPNQRFGYPIFNRNCRWCPPVDISYTQFRNSPSYPAPLGIRPKDFCLPSELINTIIELICQILCFGDVGLTYRDRFDTLFTRFGYPNVFQDCCDHMCKFCHNPININDYTSNYMSETNFIELCHRDPNSNFVKSNVYWGHGECNRKQGGNTEKEIITMAYKLLRGRLENDELTDTDKKYYRNQITPLASLLGLLEIEGVTNPVIHRSMP